MIVRFPITAGRGCGVLVAVLPASVRLLLDWRQPDKSFPVYANVCPLITYFLLVLAFGLLVSFCGNAANSGLIDCAHAAKA